MQVMDIAVREITVGAWNANRMDEAMRRRLLSSLGRYGVVQPLIVRRRDIGYETVGGAQRLLALRDTGAHTAPCVVLEDLSDADTRLLSVALNRIGGTDDVNALGDLAREVLGTLPADAITAVLPYSLSHLQNLASLADLAVAAESGPPTDPKTVRSRPQAAPEGEDAGVSGRRYPDPLQLTRQGESWERARAEGFDRLSFAFSEAQRAIVERAITRALSALPGSDAPNRRGAALASICAAWLTGLEAGDAEGPTQARVLGSLTAKGAR